VRQNIRWAILAAVLVAALWATWQYASWERDRRQAALVARAVKYAVEQFGPAYLDFLDKNRHPPRDNMELHLPPPRDSLWVGVSRAELYPNGDVFFDFNSADPSRTPQLVWHINARGNYTAGPHLCGARDIPAKVLQWNGLLCDADVTVPARDAPAPATELTVTVPPQVASPADEVLDAVRRDDAVQLDRMHKAGRDICAANSQGVTPVAEAARSSQPKSIPVLVAACDVNIVEPFSGRTPLMIASAARDVDIVRALLMAGANPVQMTQKSDSAWFLLGTSSDDNSQQIRNMMQVKGAAVDTLAADRSTLLMRAAAAGNVELATWLLQVGARIDLQDQAGRSALMYATLSPTGEATLQLLIVKKAQLNLADRDGKTALSLAQGIEDQGRQARVLDILRSAGAT
jgi:ankyrin repeat protein